MTDMDVLLYGIAGVCGLSLSAFGILFLLMWRSVWPTMKEIEELEKAQRQ